MKHNAALTAAMMVAISAGVSPVMTETAPPPRQIPSKTNHDWDRLVKAEEKRQRRNQKRLMQS